MAGARALGELLYKLEVEQLVLASGRNRWLALAAREVESVLEAIRETELLRAVAADAVAAALGLAPNPSLQRARRRPASRGASILVRPPRGLHDGRQPRSPSSPRATATCSPPATRRPRRPCSSLTEKSDGYGADGTAVRPPTAAPAARQDPLRPMSGTFSSLNIRAVARCATTASRWTSRATTSPTPATRATPAARVDRPGDRRPDAVPAIWSRCDGAGDGVRPAAVDRMVDPFLDARSRPSTASSPTWTPAPASLDRFETGDRRARRRRRRRGPRRLPQRLARRREQPRRQRRRRRSQCWPAPRPCADAVDPGRRPRPPSGRTSAARLDAMVAEVNADRGPDLADLNQGSARRLRRRHRRRQPRSTSATCSRCGSPS